MRDSEPTSDEITSADLQRFFMGDLIDQNVRNRILESLAFDSAGAAHQYLNQQRETRLRLIDAQFEQTMRENFDCQAARSSRPLDRLIDDGASD